MIKAFVHRLDDPAEALSLAWERAFRARAAFEAAAGATWSQDRAFRRWLRSYRNALNAVTAACAALETTLPAQPPSALSRDFTVAVDSYVEALCGDPATPGSPWRVDVGRLTEAAQRVRSELPAPTTRRPVRWSPRSAPSPPNSARSRQLDGHSATRTVRRRRIRLIAGPPRLDEHALGLDRHALGVGEVPEGEGLDALGADDRRPACRSPSGVVRRYRIVMVPVSRGLLGGARRLAEDVIEDQGRDPAVHVARRSLVGRTEVEVGVHPTGGSSWIDQWRRRRVAHADDGVAPRHLIAFRAEPDTEGSVELAGAQSCRRRVDRSLGLGADLAASTSVRMVASTSSRTDWVRGS